MSRSVGTLQHHMEYLEENLDYERAGLRESLARADEHKTKIVDLELALSDIRDAITILERSGA